MNILYVKSAWASFLRAFGGVLSTLQVFIIKAGVISTELCIMNAGVISTVRFHVTIFAFEVRMQE